MSFTEPTDVGPAAGGHLPVSDGDRRKVVDLLDAAYAEGRITASEHTERMDAAASVRTFDDLVPLTRDLVAFEPVPAGVASSAAPEWPSSGQSSLGEPELIVTIFGATERRGRWQPRRRLSVLNLFGATELDLREAVFTDNTCEINVFCLFGAVDVLIPDGVHVRNEALAIFGASGAKGNTPAPGAPTVVLRGFVGFGAAEARVKQPKARR